MNLFCYGGNNPVNTTDPDGHMFIFVTAGIGAIIGGVAAGSLVATVSVGRLRAGVTYIANNVSKAINNGDGASTTLYR
ncbi:hypothetical protein D3C87_1709850 [compost metagenome]